MKKFALVCSVTCLAVSAHAYAADLVQQPIASTPYSWTGVYVGAHAGGGWNNSRWSDPSNLVAPFNTNGSGGIFGGQVGYNYQMNQIVIGIEGDLSASAVKGVNHCLIYPSPCETKQDYLASLRGRLGYAMDRVLVYGDGGVAFTNYKFTERSPDQSFSGGSRIGWTVGLGAEYAFSDHWTAGVEWNYYDFGSKTGVPSVFPGQVTNRDTENVAVARINYKF